ncbi:MAG: SRPBCC family protein [Parachlamydiaceae bacterium]
MTKVEKSIEINAPPEKIWPFSKFDKLPEWYCPMKKVQWTKGEKDKVGSIAHVTGELAGMKVEWDAEITASVENRVGSYRSISGNVTSFGSTTLTPTKTGTQVTVAVDYQLPYSVLGKMLDKLKFHKAFEKSFETSLKKLKQMMEQ